MSPGPTRSNRGDRGQVAGIEALLVGALVLIVGVLVMASAWATVRLGGTLDDIAARTLRAVSAPTVNTADAARAVAVAAATTAAAEHGISPADLRVDLRADPGYGPCAEVTVTITVTVPVIRVPGIDRGPRQTRHVRRTELLPPAEQVPDADYTRRGTPCYAD